LGYLLHVQSNYDQITTWYRDYAKKQPQSTIGSLFNKLIDGGLPKGQTQKDFPDEFNAWILYKSIVNISLVNDSTSYFLLGMRCLETPESITVGLILQYLLAAALSIFFIWAKYDSHRCIGTYCWYWGDFFYRKNVSLTFDGIFELFPHPMYTVGYSAYYATVLITQSYTMLLCSLIAHMSQLLFLVIVEEPHIKKIYGDSEGTVERDEKALYDSEKGWFPSKSELVYFCSVDPYSSTTWMILFMAVYASLVAILPESPVYSVVQVLFWRFIQWGVIGYILWAQSTRQIWTKYFTSQGRTLQEAFGHWKRIYNITAAVNFIAFVAAAYRYFPELTLSTVFSMQFFAKMAGLIALTFLSVWTTYSTYHSIGDFGWFYGDFFIPPSEYTHKLCYTGIYRFLNNPDVLTGYAGFYGLGLVCQGWTVFLLAALTHGLHFMFLHTVEIPHMQRIYDHQQSPVRPAGPLRTKVKDLLTNEAKIPLGEVDQQMKQAKRTALSKFFSLYSAFNKKNNNTAVGKNSHTQLKVGVKQYTVLNSAGVNVDFTTVEDHSDTDWVGLYAVGTPSAPGLSDGCWLYAPAGKIGVLHFKPFQLPKVQGQYEFRYHTSGTYDVTATCPLQVIADTSNPNTRVNKNDCALDSAVAK
jgi:phosphatidylethanolamine N-methyltransferase